MPVSCMVLLSGGKEKNFHKGQISPQTPDSGKLINRDISECNVNLTCHYCITICIIWFFVAGINTNSESDFYGLLMENIN